MAQQMAQFLFSKAVFGVKIFNRTALADSSE
jgi:hypothetical protein